MNKNLESVLYHANLFLDKLVFSKINIPWKHNYRREKVQLYPSEELCKMIREAGGDIHHDVAYPGYFDWVLYDGNIICTKIGSRDFEGDKDLIDSTDADFLN